MHIYLKGGQNVKMYMLDRIYCESNMSNNLYILNYMRNKTAIFCIEYTDILCETEVLKANKMHITDEISLMFYVSLIYFIFFLAYSFSFLSDLTI